MKTFCKIYSLALLCVLCWGCGREVCASDGAAKACLELPLEPESATKAHFEDADGNASFVWDAGSSMIAVLSAGGSITQWDGGEYCSPMHISLIDPDSKNTVRRALSEYTLPGGAAVEGDALYFLSPVNGSSLCRREASADGVSVEFAMPHTFAQSASGAMEEFGDYCYIRGESSVKRVPSAEDKNFAANSTTFRAIPAIFRFNVTNNMEGDLVLESVKITCNRLFPDRLCWSTDGAGVQICEPEDKSGYFNTIKTSIANAYGERLASGGKGTYYAMCLPFDSDASMSGAILAFILETSDKIHTFNVPAASFFRNSAFKSFESNKIYTFNFALNENSVELEGVSIEDWMKDSFYLPIVDITADVRVNLSYWVQDRKNLYTFGFMRMFGDKTTMWAECNIGEYLYSSSELVFSWNEVTPADASDTDYLAKYYSNITDFKWRTPTRADYEELFSLPDSCYVMCKDVDSGAHGIRIKSKDRPGASIFLPCSGGTEEHTDYPEDGSTGIHRIFNGYYWTADEASDTDAYLLHFAFSQVETVVEELSTFSEYSRVLNSGNDLYEFVETPKIGLNTVRAVLYE
ncbi:MAG: hypothetical protein ACI3ZK_00300 [Candidatus Cryptobacteroides sp.]